MFDSRKDQLLRSERGVGFGDAIDAIEAGRVLLDIPHPRPHTHPNQRLLVLDIDGYAYCVPYLADGDVLVLKTLYPNRKFKHLIEGEDRG